MSINFLCVTLWHMSICARIIISVALQEIDNAPNAKSCSEGDDEGLENADSRVEKFHICVAGIIGCWLC